MFAEERKKKILEILNEKKSVTVEELNNKFTVSKVTIRNDLNEMEEENLLIRTHGGALINEFINSVPNLSEREIICKEEKEKIGNKALKFIDERDIIFLDSGTTTYQVAKNLSGINNLTVISNDFNIIKLLSTMEGIEIIIIGGRLNRSNLSIISSNSERYVEEYNFKKLFLGVSGLSLEKGIMAPNELIANLKKQMIKSAKETIAVCDSSKFGRSAFAKVCNIEVIDKIITDESIDKNDYKGLKYKGIEVVIAK